MSSRRGVLVLVLILSGLGVLLMIAALRLRRPISPTANCVVTFDLPATLEEEAPPNDFLSPRFWRRPRLTVFDVLEGIRSAAGDSRVKALVLHVDGVDWGWAKLADVRDALQEFRASGKPLYASMRAGGEAEYLLASSARVVGAPPASQLQLNGLTASALFLRGTFDKLNVRPNFLHVGRYKSAVESYTRADLSGPAREALTAMLDDTYDVLVDSLARSRKVPADSIRAWLNRGPYSAEEARRLGLVDTLLYETEMDSLAVRRAGRGVAPLTFRRYVGNLSESTAGAKIALVTASGDIASGRSRSSPMGGRVLGAETLIQALRQVRTRRSIRAVVLRIDSPGGDAQASDDIWHEIVKLRRVKPVIVSMSDVAASGGYYIAVAADTIVARPATITGSIGIFGGKFNVLGLYQKLGINVETISTGPRAEMYSPFRDFRPDEEAAFAHQLENSYRRFLELVSSGRKMPVAAVDSVAQGRVWSGRSAAAVGLVDLLGGFEDAIEVARARAGIAKDADLVIERFPQVELPFFQKVLADMIGDDEDPPSEESVALGPLRVLAGAATLSGGRAMALMPYALVIR